MPNQEIYNQIKLLIPEYQSYILSGMPSVIAKSLSEYHNLASGKYISLENAIILLLIFKLSPDQFIQFVSLECQINVNDASDIYEAVLLSLPPDVSECFTNTLVQLAAQNNIKLGVDIQKMEADLRSSTQYPEPTYTTTQAAILQEGAVAPSAPSAPSNAPAAPRWESEQV